MSDQILLIDNYDSFVFTLARYFAELGVDTIVRRNDSISLAEIQQIAPAAIVLSPGPCTPSEAGICEELICTLGKTVPLLGVCLGHQAIGSALGGKVIRAQEPVHGRASLVEHDGSGIFAGCPSPLRVTRYHSLIVEDSSLPQSLRVTARTADGQIMALAHRAWPMYGVQFHPESVLTQCGHRLLANFLHLAGIDHHDLPTTTDLPENDGRQDDFYQRAIDPSRSVP